MTPTNDFTNGSIPKKLSFFMLPILGALILQAMYGAVDLLVVGKFSTTAALSGVSTGSNVLNLFTFVITGLTMGTTVMISRYLGQKQEDKIGPLLGATICLFGLVGLFIAGLLFFFPGQLAQLMQTPSQAMAETIDYIRICGAGFLFITAYNVISAIFRGLGDSKSPLLFVGIACLVNIVGDLVFVAGLGMSASGAALATVLAQAVSVLLSLWIIKRKHLPFTLKKSDINWNDQLPQIIKVGLPIGLQELLTQVSFLALLAFINKLGLEASGGYGVASKIQSFVMLIPGALMQSMSSFVSQNVGAKKEKRAFQALVTGSVLGLSIGLLVCLGTIFFGDTVSALFSNDRAVIAQSWDYLRGFSLEAILTAILFSFMGYYNGHGQTLWVMLQGIAQTFLVRLPFAYIMSIQPDASLFYIGLAAPSATLFGIILNLVFYRHFRKKLHFIDA